MIDVLAQHRREVAGSGDQQVVEAFAAQGADSAFGERVCSWCTYRGADGVDVRAGEGRVERGGELCIPVTDQEPEPADVLAQVHEQVAGLLGHPGSRHPQGADEREQLRVPGDELAR
jgi:hypothetical protein